MLDAQTIAAAIVLLIAAIYVGRRAWLRLSSLILTKRRGALSCGEACGGCGPPKIVDLNSVAKFSNQ